MVTILSGGRGVREWISVRSGFHYHSSLPTIFTSVDFFIFLHRLVQIDVIYLFIYFRKFY